MFSYYNVQQRDSTPVFVIFFITGGNLIWRYHKHDTKNMNVILSAIPTFGGPIFLLCVGVLFVLSGFYFSRTTVYMIPNANHNIYTVFPFGLYVLFLQVFP